MKPIYLSDELIRASFVDIERMMRRLRFQLIKGNHVADTRERDDSEDDAEPDK